MQDQELIDIYDSERRLTGVTIPRRGAFLREGQFMLYVLALLEDADGRVLVTRRALDKRWAAGAWEVPGGGAIAGETSAQAVVREVREETGLDVSAQPLAPVYGYRNVDLARGDNYFVDVYHFRLRFGMGDVTIRRSEAIDARLATWDEIAALDAEGTFLHYRRLRQAMGAGETGGADGARLAR